MLATAEDVGIFLRALNDGALLNDNEQAIYSAIYVYEHTGWVLGYYSIARYHEDIDTVVIQFVNTTGGDTELTSIVVYNRIVRILRGKKMSSAVSTLPTAGSSAGLPIPTLFLSRNLVRL